MSESNSFTKHPVARSVVAAMAALALQSAPAMAQEQPRTQSVEIYGGELFGDKLTEEPVSGRNPRLNDDALAGLRYNYNFTDMWGAQLSGGYSWSRASRVPIGENKLGLTTVDLDAVWNISDAGFDQPQERDVMTRHSASAPRAKTRDKSTDGRRA